MSFDVRAHIEAHPQIHKLSVREREVAAGVLEGAVATIEPVVRDLVAERDRLHAALLVAADDLDKAANQFAGIAAWERSGDAPHVVSNPSIFAEKAARARAAASDDAAPTDAVPAEPDHQAGERR